MSTNTTRSIEMLRNRSADAKNEFNETSSLIRAWELAFSYFLK
jgi:hypothetical protein